MYLRISILNLRIGDRLMTLKTWRPSVRPDAFYRVYWGCGSDYNEGCHLLWLVEPSDRYSQTLTCLWVVRESPEGLLGA